MALEAGAGLVLVTDAKTSARMGRIRQSDTEAELAVRQCLHSLGLRYRVRNRDLPGSPDIANRTRKWVVFVHGCFWHQHSGCRRATFPKRNRHFWRSKFKANVLRDARCRDELEAYAYRVIVVWECETACPRLLRAKLRRALRGIRGRS